MEEKYLLMVTPQNNNKFYHMKQVSGEAFDVSYGRVGEPPRNAHYQMSDWNKKYNEKLRKGYNDVTHLQVVSNNQEPENEYQPIANDEIRRLIDYLQQLARQTIRNNYTISVGAVTPTMITEVQWKINQLLNKTDIRSFNETLLDLFEILPRKMKSVQSYMAGSTEHFAKIINREQELLDVMNGQVMQPVVNLTKPLHEGTILDAAGIHMESVSDKDIEVIKKNLGECADKFYKAWRVTNTKTQAAFDEFLAGEKPRFTKKLLWHGSRNENWWSILQTGLMLRPTNAAINGKMFGYGLYFANKALKSLGYTSLYGAKWTHGTRRHCFMALHVVAYGTPHVIDTWDSYCSNLNKDRLKAVNPNANCLHVKAGKSLYNDEIIIYDEAQTTIKYLVELKDA